MSTTNRDEVERAGVPPLDPIKHPLRDEAEHAWIAGYARQGVLSYSKRPPSPFAQFLQGFVAGRETPARTVRLDAINSARSALSRPAAPATCALCCGPHVGRSHVPAPATEAKCGTCGGTREDRKQTHWGNCCSMDPKDSCRYVTCWRDDFHGGA